MSVNTTTFAKDDPNVIAEDMDDIFKALEAPSLGRSCGAPTSEYGNSSDNFLSRYLEQHTTAVDFGTSFMTFDTRSPKYLSFDWDHPIGESFIQHHGLHPSATDSSNHFVYFTHPTRESEGTAYVACRLISRSHLFDVESVERDGVRALLSEEQYVEYLKCQRSQGYCPRSFSPPPPSVCLQPVDTSMSTGLSWEYSGSNLTGVHRAINEGVTVEPLVLRPSPDATAAILPLPTYVSAFGTGMDLDCVYEDLSQEEVSDCHSNWDKPIGSPLVSGQRPGVTPSTRRQPVKSVLRKNQAYRKKSSTSRKHSLPSIIKSPLLPPANRYPHTTSERRVTSPRK
ncbi:hypothetical protein EV421DRAFT_2032190 [Armillaria borealis]|uniref:Uncharacterized protein n=1 Tax=Armillaria borealis TaxID=47425 RepID=A0AA39MXA2_9AGAR|nr:hypothetical protein EV421DRAFT_2032190 [Armillaria borealis]